MAEIGEVAGAAHKVLEESRRTVSTELRERGAPGWEVSGLVGHHKGTTEIYAKFDPAYLGKARRRSTPGCEVWHATSRG